ncbi:RNA polymerase sigma factor [Chloroflexota bacterium]
MKPRLKYGTQTNEIKTAGKGAQSQSEINTLVEKAARRDMEAFGELYGIFLDPIYRYVLYQVKDKMTAEDIVEEVFVKAWHAIESCKGKGKTFSPWLYRIAHNHLLNTLKSAKKYTSLEGRSIPETGDLESEFELRLDQKELREKVFGLPHNQKQVIILKFIEGFSNREIARIMGKNEGAVRILQMRALTSLRQSLSSESS